MGIGDLNTATYYDNPPNHSAARNALHVDPGSASSLKGSPPQEYLPHSCPSRVGGGGNRWHSSDFGFLDTLQEEDVDADRVHAELSALMIDEDGEVVRVDGDENDEDEGEEDEELVVLQDEFACSSSANTTANDASSASSSASNSPTTGTRTLSSNRAAGRQRTTALKSQFSAANIFDALNSPSEPEEEEEDDDEEEEEEEERATPQLQQPRGRSYSEALPSVLPFSARHKTTRRKKRLAKFSFSSGQRFTPFPTPTITPTGHSNLSSTATSSAASASTTCPSSPTAVASTPLTEPVFEEQDVVFFPAGVSRVPSMPPTPGGATATPMTTPCNAPISSQKQFCWPLGLPTPVSKLAELDVKPHLGHDGHDHDHPVDSTSDEFKKSVAKLHSLARLCSLEDFESALKDFLSTCPRPQQGLFSPMERHGANLMSFLDLDAH